MKTTTLIRLLIAALMLFVFTNLDSTGAVVYGGYQAVKQVMDCKLYAKYNLDPKEEAEFIIKDTVKGMIFYKPIKLAFFMIAYGFSGKSEFFNELKQLIYGTKTTFHRGNFRVKRKGGGMGDQNGGASKGG